MHWFVPLLEVKQTKFSFRREPNVRLGHYHLIFGAAVVVVVVVVVVAIIVDVTQRGLQVDVDVDGDDGKRLKTWRIEKDK